MSAAWLAKLPDGVLLFVGGRLDPSMRELLGRGRVSARLDYTDAVTAAAVAARIVGPWLDTQPDARAGRSVTGGRSEASAITGAAMRMELLTPEQISTLARLARAAMEER